MRHMKYLLMLLVLPGTALAQLGAVRGQLNCPDVGVGSTFKCARATEASLNAPFVKRVNDSLLVITLANGNTTQFLDRDRQDPRGVAYTAVAVSSDFRYVVLHRQHWEGGASSMLDRQTGTEARLEGYPAVSPDGRWVAVVNADLAAGYSPNVLRIYRITPAGLSLEHDARPDKWGAVDAVWTSATSLEYMHATPDCYEARHGESYTCERKTLRYGGAQWR